MMTETQTLQESVKNVRSILLELHKTLIDLSRIDYERDRKPIESPGEWINLLMNDEFFNWLHPLSTIITSLDELLELNVPLQTIDATAVRAEIENLISEFPTSPNHFRSQYLIMLQREPSVVIIHSKLKQHLQNLPKPESEKMNELLKVKSQWSAARRMKSTPKNKLPS